MVPPASAAIDQPSWRRRTPGDNLNLRAFAGGSGSAVQPDGETAAGFNTYMERCRALPDVERKSVEVF